MTKLGWSFLLMSLMVVLFILLPSGSSLGADGMFSEQLETSIQAQLDRTPICLERGNIPAEEIHWLYMPSQPEELATDEYYAFLSGELIRAGVVDASECPLGGLWLNGYANSCGLQKAREAALYLQNIYDDEILTEGAKNGVPPVMLKQLIRYESQFWPVRVDQYHYGLGHVTYLGADNALMWNPELYHTVCRSAYNAPCASTYFQASQQFNNLLAWHLLSLMDTNCPACQYKFDIAKAEQSISYIAQVLVGFCKQTTQIVYNATEYPANYSVDYATIWKLTLLNYNAGPNCVFNMIKTSFKDQSKLSDDEDADDKDKYILTEKLSWSLIASNAGPRACQTGVTYVNNITRKYYTFTDAVP